MTRIALAAGVGAAFIAALVATFPTDVVMRRAVRATARPGWPQIDFRTAKLRPGGIVLSDVALRRPARSGLLTLDAIELRPSLRALLGGRVLPLNATASACGGRAEAAVRAADDAVAVVLTWHGVDLTACPRLAIAGAALAGRADGTAAFVLPRTAAPTGRGTVELRAAHWRTDEPTLPGLDLLRAESASLRWSLREGCVVLETIELRGPEVIASGRGEVWLADPVEASDLRLELALEAGPDAPGAVRLLLGADGQPRALDVRGTIGAPRVVTP